MKFVAATTRSLQADMQAELRGIERAVATETRDAGRGLRTELRRQVASAGLGQRLANSWRDRHYPNQKLDAASLVYTNAPQIIRAFDEGAVIRSRRRRAHTSYMARCVSCVRCVHGDLVKSLTPQGFLRFLAKIAQLQAKVTAISSLLGNTAMVDQLLRKRLLRTDVLVGLLRPALPTGEQVAAALPCLRVADGALFAPLLERILAL